jgi:hypothetical protein
MDVPEPISWLGFKQPTALPKHLLGGGRKAGAGTVKYGTRGFVQWLRHRFPVYSTRKSE